MWMIDGYKSILRKIAQSKFGVRILLWSVRNMSVLIPTQKLYESSSLVAFFHPQPTHATHVLILPKQALMNFMELTPVDDALICEITHAARQIVHQLGLDEHGYRLIVNGGEYQDIGQLHYHLISDTQVDQTGL